VTNEKVAVAKEKLKEARTRQKSYADNHRRSIEFQPGDRVFLKVKENQEKDKIRSKPDKNGKCGEARKSLKQLQLKEEEKPKKTKKEWPKTHTRIKSY
nr:putative reverse transcriptase domain-containing protein [Tanacetum cinerariifolium]